MSRDAQIGVPQLISWAKKRGYNWFGSLAPIREELLKTSGPLRSSCRNCPKRTPNIPDEVIARIVRNRQFLIELERMKKILKYDRMIVSVGTLRTVI